MAMRSCFRPAALRACLIAALMLAETLVTGIQASPVVADGEITLFEDDFASGTLDTSKWAVELINGGVVEVVPEAASSSGYAVRLAVDDPPHTGNAHLTTVPSLGVQTYQVDFDMKWVSFGWAGPRFDFLAFEPGSPDPYAQAYAQDEWGWDNCLQWQGAYGPSTSGGWYTDTIYHFTYIVSDDSFEWRVDGAPFLEMAHGAPPLLDALSLRAWDEGQDVRIWDVEVTSGPPEGVDVVNLGIIPINTADESCWYDVAYYEEVGQKVADYFWEVSYETLYVSVTVHHQADGSYFEVPESSDWYRAWYRNLLHYAFFEHAIDACDNVIDFTMYDPDPEGGMGVVAFIDPGLETEKGPFICCNCANEIYATDDGTDVDCIYVPEWRFNGSSKVVRGLAHEFAHALGKLLVTTVQGSPKDTEWFLPDTYDMGDLDCYWDLMGTTSDSTVEEVHLCSYTKEWLGWLEYVGVEVDDVFSLEPLTALEIGAGVPRYQLVRPSWDGYGTFYLIEHRTNIPSAQNEWDTETAYDAVVAFYELEVRPDVDPALRGNDTLNLVGRVSVGGGWFGDADEGVIFFVDDLDSSGAEVHVAECPTTATIGASVYTTALLLSQTIAESTGIEEGILNQAPPDIDLHAHSDAGEHVGVNYETGQYEREIPGAIASGDLVNGREWIFVPEGTSVTFSVSSKDNQAFMEANPGASDLTDGEETYFVSTVYYDSEGVRYESEPLTQPIASGVMLEHDHEIIDNGDGTYTPTVLETTAEIPLMTGWNMVSVPVVPTENSTEAVFPEVEAVYTWDSESKSYTMPSTIDPRKAYWVAVTSDRTISVTGAPVTEWIDSASPGWNMLGSVHGGIVDFSDPDDIADGSVEGFVYWWNPETKAYEYCKSIDPGKGYWIAATQDCSLTLGPPT